MARGISHQSCPMKCILGFRIFQTIAGWICGQQPQLRHELDFHETFLFVVLFPVSFFMFVQMHLALLITFPKTLAFAVLISAVSEVNMSVVC